MLIGLRARYPADCLAGTDTPQVFLYSFSSEPPPVGIHANLQCGMAEDGGSPVDRVDLRHQRVIDEAGDTENLVVLLRIVLPFGKRLKQVVADGVVLQREQVVQQA